MTPPSRSGAVRSRAAAADGASGAPADHRVAVASPPARSAANAPAVAAGQMALVDHLRELRRRLAFVLLALLVGVVVAFLAWEPIYAVLREPYCRTPQGSRNCDLYSIGLFDQFRVRLHVALVGGTVLSAPMWLYQIGAFITPGLHRHERRYALGFLAASLVFFALGCAFAFLTVHKGLEFLLTIGGGHVVTLVSVQSYLSFVTLCLVAFGVAFEFPVLVLFLHLVGAFPAARMQAWRKGMIVGIAVAAAVITPSQDPISFLAMAGPLWVMYEACILVARGHERAVRRRRAADPLASLSDDTASPLEVR